MKKNILTGWLKPDSIGLMVILFLLVRVVSLLTMPLSGLLGYGDFPNYIQLARLPGWPFINFWVEFPPIFPFLISILNKLTAGHDQTFYYLLAIILILVDAVNLIMFIKIVQRVHGMVAGTWRILTYFAILVSLSYAWWYLDSLAVLGLLLGILFLIDKRDMLAASAIAFGTLVKLFPILLLVIPWRYGSKLRALKISLVSFSIVLVVYGALFLASPVFAKASINSLFNKSSWETVWAMLDGNYNTGLLGSYSNRLQPELSSIPQGNPAVINPKWTLLLFAGIGLWAFTRHKNNEIPQIIAFLGLTFCLLFLWSPGWSPQWVLYLLPVILLCLPFKEGLLFSVELILVNILEWPVLLSRGLFNELWVTISLRTIIFILAGITLYQFSTSKKHILADQSLP